MSESNLPKGWDAERVQKVIDHYESQTEDEQASEIEAAVEGTTWVAVPTDLVQEVRTLIEQKQGRKQSA